MEPQEDLTYVQKEMLAGLLESPAYLLMMEVLKKEVTALEGRMEQAPDDKTALRAMNYWKILRWVHNELRTQPARFAEELREYLDDRRAKMGGEYFPDVRVNTPVQAYLPWGPAESDSDDEI